MPNEGSGRGGFGGGGNYQKVARRSQLHTEHGVNVRGPVESGGYRQPYYRGGQTRYSPPPGAYKSYARGAGPQGPPPLSRGYRAKGPSGRTVYHTRGAWKAIQAKQGQQASSDQVRRALALASLLRNSLPVGMNVGLSSLLANSSVGKGVANVQAGQTWDKISALFPKGAKQPQLAFDSPSQAWAYTDRKNGQSTVHLNPSNIRDLSGHSPLASVLYGDTEAFPKAETDRRLAHEFAHSQQTNPYAGPKAEGGAEAFSKIAEQVLNPGAKPAAIAKSYKGQAVPAYQQLANWYMRNYGPRSVLRGQFGK